MPIDPAKLPRIRETFPQLGAEVLAAIHGVTAAEIMAVVRHKPAANISAPVIAAVVPPAERAIQRGAPIVRTPAAPQPVEHRQPQIDLVGAGGYVPLMSDRYRRRPS